MDFSHTNPVSLSRTAALLKAANTVNRWQHLVPILRDPCKGIFFHWRSGSGAAGHEDQADQAYAQHQNSEQCDHADSTAPSMSHDVLQCGKGTRAITAMHGARLYPTIQQCNTTFGGDVPRLPRVTMMIPTTGIAPHVRQDSRCCSPCLSVAFLCLCTYNRGPAEHHGTPQRRAAMNRR